MLLQSVHEAGDGAVQIFVGAAKFFDFVDGVENSSVMFAAELAANLGKRGRGKLFDDIHVDLGVLIVATLRA
jgi:hypothetical protein